MLWSLKWSLQKSLLCRRFKSDVNRIDGKLSELLIADIGCGEGRSTQTLAKIFTNSNVHGLDIDHTSILQAEQDNHLSNVEFIGERVKKRALER